MSLPSSALFHRLAPPVQKWLHGQGWHSLRPVQEEAGPIILAGKDAIISASTAGGKTEAAFLPLISRAYDTGDEAPGSGVKVLYVGPLKALINDQFLRLESLCERAEMKVVKWHGDAPPGPKAALLKKPDGVMLITPESLEAILMKRPLNVRSIFEGLQAVIIDEFHAFLGVARGQQLMSLLDRIEHVLARPVQRVALSATLGSPQAAARVLRWSAPSEVEIINPVPTSDRLIKLQVRGYEHRKFKASESHVEAQEDRPEGSVEAEIARHLFRVLRTSNNLVFGGSKANVETYSTRLREICEQERVPNQFFPHHGNLSKDQRESVEKRLKSDRLPTTAICTSTLEMGIDIGSVQSIAEIGPPFSVSSMLQRLGRSGRRNEPSTVRFYISEQQLDHLTPLSHRLRPGLFQSLACIELMFDHWCETPRVGGMDLSTLVHQTLSAIVQHSGANAAKLYALLCGKGAFQSVDKETFIELLRSLASQDPPLIEQSSSGLIMLAEQGELITDHYSFCAVFQTPEEYRIVTTSGQNLGSMPLLYPYKPGDRLVFAGRRWVIHDLDDTSKTLLVRPQLGGNPPKFEGDMPPIDCAIANRMYELYCGRNIPAYMDGPALKLFNEGQAAFTEHQLADRRFVQTGGDVAVFTWTGTYVTLSLMYYLKSQGFDVRLEEHFMLLVRDAELEKVRAAINTAELPDALGLTKGMANLGEGKFAEFLSPTLNAQAYASNHIDLQQTQSLISVLRQFSCN